MSRLVLEKEEIYALPIGSKIWFSEERGGYEVIAKGGQYLVCTKPFNPRHTVLYTILDVESMMRGPEDLIFGLGAETVEQCQDITTRLMSRESSLSSRRSIAANIVRIEATAVSKRTRNT